MIERGLAVSSCDATLVYYNQAAEAVRSTNSVYFRVGSRAATTTGVGASFAAPPAPVIRLAEQRSLQAHQ
jgi:hypothetical protein